MPTRISPVHGKYFTDILQTAIDRGVANDNSRASIEWFRKMVKAAASPSRNELVRQFDSSRYRNKGNIAIGQMLFFYYDPKLKAELPYYDNFPLIIVLDVNKTGFLGLNLHYLPPYIRAVFFDALTDTMSTRKYTDTTRMMITYKLIKGLTKYKWFKACIKKYLTNHLRSKMMILHPTEWNPAIFLPVADFQKKSQAEVWADSQRKVTGKGPRMGGRAHNKAVAAGTHTPKYRRKGNSSSGSVTPPKPKK